ncbi:MAG: tRNA guanosine(34) transglycosylase Tgt [Chloroflexi bacterium]|nr:tRNA guanosine(34) transglycosylase Tgt [Chloroflexota bacterium]
MGRGFDVVAICSTTGARAGLLRTRHGPIETPTFMPVGTQGTVKGLTPGDLHLLGAQCVLGNAYHLWLQPGHAVVRGAGGLHAFTSWDGPILTDSGGFQVLSLADLRRIDERGVTFRSHLNGEERPFTPELAMEVQAALGSDIAMVLDLCPPYPSMHSDLQEATERTTRWARRARVASRASGQMVFGIVQGGTDVVLRRWSAESLSELDFDGYGIGGLSVGEERERTWAALNASLGALPPDRPRYLMGVGAPADLLAGIARGIDLFDCVMPTRLGRNGAVFTPFGRLNLRNAAVAGRDGPLDPSCACPACVGFSSAYLHHLVRAREELGLRLASMHNLSVLMQLARDAREAIISGTFGDFVAEALEIWGRPEQA